MIVLFDTDGFQIYIFLLYSIICALLLCYDCQRHMILIMHLLSFLISFKIELKCWLNRKEC